MLLLFESLACSVKYTLLHLCRMGIIITAPKFLFSGASAAPMEVRVSALNSTAVFVQWGRIDICRTANGRIVKYRVQYRAGPNGMVQTVDKPGNRSAGGNISIAGLSPFTVYYVQVAAVNENGDVGLFSNPKAVQTGEDGNGVE